jgi:hypothetical protein
MLVDFTKEEKCLLNTNLHLYENRFFTKQSKGGGLKKRVGIIIKVIK